MILIFLLIYVIVIVIKDDVSDIKKGAKYEHNNMSGR